MKHFNHNQRMFYENFKKLNFCLPAFVLSFDPVKQRAQVQPAIDRVDVNGWSEKLPALIDLPVRFIGGNQFHIEHQIDQGDEGIIYFSQRCIDIWKQTGGNVRNDDGRICNISDGFFGVGYRSDANIITDFANNGVRIRNKSGNQSVWLKNDESIELYNTSGFVRIQSDGTVNINGVTFKPNGDVKSPTTIEAQTVNGSVDVTFAGISGKEHVHSGVQSGNQNSGRPVR